MTKDLISVFEDTCKRIDNGEYDSELKSYKHNIDAFKSDYLFDGKGKLSVDNMDCILVAQEFSKLGKTCVLNMASHKRPGGGVARGARAQEEELSRRSNLVYGLPEEYYPLSDKEYIYTNNVTFFKDDNYDIISEFDCDVITIPAININNGLPRDYNKLMENKVRTMLYEPFEQDCTNLVLSAFGCGVFKNDPFYVAKLFKRILDEGFLELYDNVSFAIINDRNSVSDNYVAFKNILG